MSGVAQRDALQEPLGQQLCVRSPSQNSFAATQLRTPIPQTLYFTGCTAEDKELQSPEAETPDASLLVF
jgi:hypothetical protein